MRAFILAAAILYAVAGSAAAGEPSEFDRFALWNDCGPVVPDANVDGGDEIGLTEESIATAARSRFRAARLYSGDFAVTLRAIAGRGASLRLDVHIVGPAFNVAVDFVKPVQDVASGVRWSASTWSRASTGTHGRDPGYLLGIVARYLDSFIDEYLRVNESACAKR